MRFIVVISCCVNSHLLLLIYNIPFAMPQIFAKKYACLPVEIIFVKRIMMLMMRKRFI